MEQSKWSSSSQKNDEQSPISLFPLCGKIFECLLYNEMSDFFTTNDLISTNQSGL